MGPVYNQYCMGQHTQPNNQNGQPDDPNNQPNGQNGQPDEPNKQPNGQNGQPDGPNGQPNGPNGQHKWLSGQLQFILCFYLLMGACQYTIIII